MAPDDITKKCVWHDDIVEKLEIMASDITEIKNYIIKEEKEKELEEVAYRKKQENKAEMYKKLTIGVGFLATAISIIALIKPG